MYNSPVNKKPTVAGSYSLCGISSLKLVFSLGMLPFIGWNISLKISEVIRNECYNYILLTAALQAEFHKILRFFCFLFFFIQVFFHGHWRLKGQQGKEGDHFWFHTTTSTRSRTFRHLLATLHVRWLSHIFNCTTCIYQTAVQWNLPPYWITVWLIDDILSVRCIINWLILNNLQEQLLWTWYEQLVLTTCKHHKSLKADCESYKLYHTNRLM